MAAPISAKPGWRFGVFEVDARRGELRRTGVSLKLRDQSFQILLALLEKPGEIVTREELRRLLWPSNTFVDFDHGLNTAMMKLRDALGDSTEAPIYIETIPKRGYRFVAPVLPSGEQIPATSARDSAISSVLELPIHADSKSAAAPARVGTSRPSRLMAAGIGCLLLAVAALLIYAWIGHRRVADQNKEPWIYKIVPLTSSPGQILAPAVSPDGRMLAYLWDGPQHDRWELYVKLIGDELPHRITYDGGRFGYPAWSPDGLQIAFVRCDLSNRGAVYIVPALGGSERRITDAGCPYNLPSEVAWSSYGGGQLVFVDHCLSGGPFGIVSFSFSTGERHCLTDAGPQGFERRFAFSLSPDGTRIAFIPSTDAQCEIDIMPLSDKMPKQVFRDNDSCLELMWSPDGHSILFKSLRTAQVSLWRISARGGGLQKEPLYPAIGRFSADGRRMVYGAINQIEPPAVWRADLASPGGKVLMNRKVISTLTSDLDAQPSPDGTRVVWMSKRTGANEIWICGANGEDPRQVTHLKSYAGSPRWSPDGKWIAFDFDQGSAQVFVIDSEGRNLRQVTSGNGVNVVPNWSRDGKWIYFASQRTGRKEVWKHSLDSGKELQVTTDGGFDPWESFDGKMIYFSKFDQPGVWSIPSQGGKESIVIEGKPQALYWGYWALTKPGIYFLNVYAEPKTRIDFFDFATRRSRALFDLDKVPAWAQPSLSATADGKTLYYAQQEFQGAVMMMEFAQ